MDKKTEGVLVRIREKLDRHDQIKHERPDEARRSVEKMIDSLDKLIYHHHYFGKPVPVRESLSEIKTLLKEVTVDVHTDIECVKNTIDSVLNTRKAKLRMSFGQ